MRGSSSCKYWKYNKVTSTVLTTSNIWSCRAYLLLVFRDCIERDGNMIRLIRFIVFSNKKDLAKNLYVATFWHWKFGVNVVT